MDDDADLRIQTFRPTWDEFKDFSKFIKYMESKGAHKAGLARVIPPPEYKPRKGGYDLTKLNIKIEKPICQAVAKVPGVTDGIYQQVNVPMQSMSVPEFQEKANSPNFATPAHVTHKDLEQQYWKNITSHAGIYGADVNGSITDEDVESWNINKLNTILDYVSRDYDISIAGVNTGYLYFGMWKTTFAWHTEDMDLYSINYLHFGAPKTWYAISPKYGRKFEKLAAVLFPKSYDACKAFLRHKMTIINPKWLKDYDIPYDVIVQEEGHFMITFPFGYHCGFNHGFNCAESTNFAIERWIEYGKHASICYCSPDSVKIAMDAFVKRFQPTVFDAWKAGLTTFTHPEYHVNPADKPKPVTRTRLSFKERNPELDLDAIMLNPNVPALAKSQLKGSFFVSAEEEAEALVADLNGADRQSILDLYNAESSDDEQPKKRKRKKHDSDYDDDWYETKGHAFISEDGKTVKNERGRLPKPRRGSSIRKTLTPKIERTIPASQRHSAPSQLCSTVNLPADVCLHGTKVQMIKTKETEVMVMSSKPSGVPNILPKTAEATIQVQKGPSFNSAFASFVQNHSRISDPGIKLPKSNPDATAIQAKVIVQPITQKRIPVSPKTESIRKVQQEQEDWTKKVLLQSQLPKTTEIQQRATCERIQPYVAGQFQANRTDIGEQSFYTIKAYPSTSKSQEQQAKTHVQKQPH